MLKLICAAAAACTLITPLLAQDLRPADIPRYENNYSNLGWSLARALNRGTPQDVETLVEVMRGAADFSADPVGDWACRTIKLADDLPLTIYGNFKCRISQVERGHWRLEKLTGSQLTSGDLFQTEGSIEFFGVGYTSQGPATNYAGLPPDNQTPVEPGQTVAVIGLFEQMGPNRARLMQSGPILESHYDILYLTR